MPSVITMTLIGLTGGLLTPLEPPADLYRTSSTYGLRMSCSRPPVGVRPLGVTRLKICPTASDVVMFAYAPVGLLQFLWFKKYISKPSSSYSAQIGAIAESASLVSAHREPLMLPLSSTRRMVSKSLKKA
ncbi:hypothetical protein ACKS0A_01907 [Histoplasma ohiense]